MFSKLKSFSSAMGVAVLLAVCIASQASAQSSITQVSISPTTLPATVTATNGLSLTLSSSSPSGTAGENITYNWTVTNTSNATIFGVFQGSHWRDYCVSSNTSPSCIALPQGPTVISVGAGCAIQSDPGTAPGVALFGVWCTPDTGVTLAPNDKISGSVTVRPVAGGPVDYTIYMGHNANINGVFDGSLSYTGTNAPAATDVQITGAASTGSPLAGSSFSYTYQIKNAGPWGTYGGIIFTDTLPGSLTYFSSSVVETASLSGPPETFTDLCSAVGQTVVCKLNDMTVGGLWNQATVTINVLAPGTAQAISNTATVHTVSPQTDSNVANNSVTVNVATK